MLCLMIIEREILRLCHTLILYMSLFIGQIKMLACLLAPWTLQMSLLTLLSARLGRCHFKII